MPTPDFRPRRELYGFRVRKRLKTADPQVVAALSIIPVANISDVMSRSSAGGTTLRPLHAGGHLAGVAVTVRTRPGDNLLLHKALDIAGSGDVIVVDAGGDLTNSLMGEMMATYAAGRGVAGIVIDGAIRDAAAIRREHFPVYAAGVPHRGPYRTGPGEINVPVSVAGMVVLPGDIILGDEDGLLCVPQEEASEILLRAQAVRDHELRQMQTIREGNLDREWVDKTLAHLGCVQED